MRCNRKQLAKILGHDVKTITKMVDQGMPFISRPGEPSGSRTWVFDTLAVINWLAADTSASQAAALRSAKTRILEAKAGLREIEYLQQLGIVRRNDDAIREFEEVLQTTMSRILAIPSRVALRLAYETDPEKWRVVIQREVDAAFVPSDAFLERRRELAARARETERALASGKLKPETRRRQP